MKLEAKARLMAEELKPIKPIEKVEKTEKLEKQKKTKEGNDRETYENPYEDEDTE